MTRNIRLRALLPMLAALLTLAGAGSARAHGIGGAALLGSTADGGGALKLVYDFSSAQQVSFSLQIGPTALYTALVPSFDSIAADDPANGLFALNAGVTVRVELTAFEPGKTSMNVNGTTLDTVGESTVIGVGPNFHQHPTWQLLLSLPVGEYGSGSVSFKLTTTAAGYSASQVYTVVLSNAHLAPPSLLTTEYDKAAVACQATVGKEDRKLVATKLTQLGKCLDKLFALSAKEAISPPVSLATAQKAADKACNQALVDKLENALADAGAKIEKACGSLGSADYDANLIATHLNYVDCRAEQILGAGYGGAIPELAEYDIGGTPLSDFFPCLGGTTP